MATIFDTTANTEFNSFSDPFNPANMNPGQWGINPNYLTPSYSAPYRPRYNGPQGGWANPNQPGFLQSVGNFANPFASSPMYGNPHMNNAPYAEQIHSRPIDAFMWANQRIVIPASSIYLSYKLGNITTSRLNSMGGEWAARATQVLGGSAAAQAEARATQGVFSAIGDRFASGTVNGMFGAARMFSKAGVLGEGAGAAAFRVAVAEGAGIVGGVASGLLLPGLLGIAGAHAFSRVAVDPYIAYRRTGSDLRRNFQNVNIAGGGAGGGVFSGQGMSFSASNDIARDINKAGIHDFTFNEGQMSQISDFSARAGLLDDATISQISKRVKNIANQVKMVMRIANEPDIKSAIEMLSRLSSSGASVSSGEAGRALSAIGANASIAGISTQRMMSTSGATGEYLFRANGMVPYMGQIAASASMATFGSAYRQGAMSSSLRAIMGGEEGATQSSITAQVNGSQTMYNRIVMANRYMGNFTGQGVTGNINAFGANFARNPIGAYGEMMMNSGLMSSRQFAERGALGLQDQVMDLARNIPGMMKRNGRIDAANAYTLMTGSMGLSHDQAFAYIQQLTAAQNPAVQRQMLSGNDQFTTNQMTQQAEQMGLGYGRWSGPIRTARTFGQNIIDFMSGGPTSGHAIMGHIADAALSKFYGFKYGDEYGGGGSLNNINSLKNMYKMTSTTGSSPSSSFGNVLSHAGMAGGLIGIIGAIAGSTDTFNPSDFTSSSSTSYGARLQQSLNSIGGGSALGSLQKLQAAKVLIGKGADLDTSDPEVRRLMGIIGANAGNVREIAGETVRTGAQGRVLGFGALFGTEDPEKIMSEVSKNPEKYLTGGFLDDFKSASTDGQKQMAVIASAIKSTSNTKWDRIPSGAIAEGTPDELVALSATQEAGSRRANNIMKLAKEGKIDASTFTMSLASNKMLEASENMLRAAETISGKPVGASADSASPVSEYSGAGMISFGQKSGGMNPGFTRYKK